jgi:hypothetical protein
VSGSLHESFTAAHAAAGPSDRSFGVTVGGILTLLGLWRWWAVGLAPLAALLLAVGLALVLGGLVVPAALAPLNRAWTALGLLLGRIVTPVVMAFIYVLAFVPTGLVMRARGRDLLRLRREPDAPSYWIERRPPGPAPDAMTDQF